MNDFDCTPARPADRHSYRAVVAAVAARARATLPEAMHGRIASAIRLVLTEDVHVLDDGTIEVGSSSDPLKTYTLTGHACSCQDFTHGQAPDGWCQHRLAAGIAKRVQQELRAATAPIDVTPRALPPGPPPPLPEVPIIMSTMIMLEGRQVEVKLCDTDDARLLARLTALLQQFPVEPASPLGAPLASASPVCAVHGIPMKLNHGKDGSTWHSHKTLDGWCKGHGARSA